MDIRYQVFVSSTYADLQDERQEVMQALLELDCIPAGMELFPAADEDQWTLIKKVIDDCDYYVVIIAGRYGSIGPDGISYTEMEYRYAIETGKPVIGFIHKSPDDLPVSRCESEPESKAKLDEFRELVKKKVCRFWESPADLGSKVSRSLIKLIKSSPGVGWVRGDLVPGRSAAEEILQLKKQIDTLKTELEIVKTEAPEGTGNLSQGADFFTLHFSFVAASPTQWSLEGTTYRSKTITTWNNIFAAVSPLMIDEATDEDFKTGLNNLVINLAHEYLRNIEGFKGHDLMGYKISEDDFQTVKVQLKALGLIAKSTRNRSVKDTNTYWTLTPYGDTAMTRLRAIHKYLIPEKEVFVDKPELEVFVDKPELELEE